MNLDMAVLRELEERGLITIRPHSSRPLFIANYTPGVQFDRLWDEHEYLKLCRGIIFDPDGYVWSRPFPKFFNLGEHQGPLPTGAFEVTEKLDGSLGILYGRGDWAIATRGSFHSEQADVATQMLDRYRELLDEVPEDRTLLFEILYPENRIVVDYGDKRDLVLIAVIDNETGRDDNSVKWELAGFPTAKKYTDIKSVRDLLVAQMRDEGANFEGYVVRWLEDDYRLKVKLDSYLRLHRIMTNVTPKGIWEALRNGDDFSAWLDNVPDEFAAFVHEWREKLTAAYENEERIAKENFQMCINTFEGMWPDRKQFADATLPYLNRDILFLMYDGRDYSQRIWKLVQPPPAVV